MEKLPITLVSIVHNAGGRLKQLIEKHREVVSEVIIVDQYSTDGTYEEALKLADRVYRKRKKGTSDPDRDWAFSLANNPFVLYLDDDEYLTEEAIALLPDILRTGGEAFWFQRANFVDGVNIQELAGTDEQCRLFRKGAVRFPDQIHTYPKPANDISVFYLDVKINHERTLDQLKRANKAREVVASDSSLKLQKDFLARLESFFKTGLRPSR